MFAKIDILKDMEYLTDIDMLSTLILDQLKKKETPTLTEMSKAIARKSDLKINQLEEELKKWKKI